MSKFNKCRKLVLIFSIVALCCFMFAGAAFAANFDLFAGENPATGDMTNTAKADHTYNFTVEADGLNVDFNQFTSQYPYGDSRANCLIIDFPFYLEDDNLAGLGSKALPVYLTINGDEAHPLFTSVIPVAIEGASVCGDADASVVDRVYLAIERQNLSGWKTTDKITGFKIEGLTVKTPRHPNADYCVDIHHSKNCFDNYCMSLNVVETVEAVVIDDVIGCSETTGNEKDCGCAMVTTAIAGNEVVVNGHVLSTDYIWADPNDDTALYPDDCDYARFANKSSWPVLIEVRQQTQGVDCDGNCTVAYAGGIKDPRNLTGYEKDPCGTHDTYLAGVCSTTDVIASAIVHIDANGNFSKSIVIPACATNWSNLVIVARTIETRDGNQDNGVDFKMNYPDGNDQVPAEALEDVNTPMQIDTYGTDEANRHHIKWGTYDPAAYDHAWLQSDHWCINVIAGSPFAIMSEALHPQITMATPEGLPCCGEECYSYAFVIRLVDKYGNDTVNENRCNQGYTVTDIKVDLLATYKEGGLPKLAGKFYDADPCNPQSGAKVIDYAFIKAGQSNITVYFVPTKVGSTDIQFGAFVNKVQKFWAQCGVEVNYDTCMLEATYLVTGDECGDKPTDNATLESPKAGWPVKISVHYPLAGDLRVELVDDKYMPVTWATWDNKVKALNKDGGDSADYLKFEAIGDYQSGDLLTHPNVSYDTEKSDFFVYTDRTACGKHLIVKVVDVANNIKDEIVIGPYVSPTDMVRVLAPDSWQILSTPKTIAADDGNIKSLMDNEVFYTEVLTYKDNGWQQITSESLDPLYAYVVKTKQNVCTDSCATGDCFTKVNWYATYIFDRAVNTTAAMPKDRLLDAGANLIGPSFNEKEVSMQAAYFKDSINYESCCGSEGQCCPTCQIPTEENCMVCDDLLFQGDTLYRLTGTFCEGCTMIMTYGYDSGLDTVIGGDGYNGGLWSGQIPVTYYGEPNSMGNLTHFTTAAIGQGSAYSWVYDPAYMAFNGDGYIAYLTNTQTYQGAAQLQLVNVDSEQLEVE